MQRTKLLIIFGMLISVGVSVIAGNKSNHVQAIKTTTPSRIPEQISQINEVLQNRFHELNGFGIERIKIEAEKDFVPQTDVEKAVVGKLKKEGFAVSIFLAGRVTLQPTPTRKQWNGGLGRTIDLPIHVGAKISRKNLPSRLALWTHARKAIRHFERKEELYEFEQGGWQFVAYPIRAEQDCLKCHIENPHRTFGANFSSLETDGTKLKVGDPLGALLYAYVRQR